MKNSFLTTGRLIALSAAMCLMTVSIDASAFNIFKAIKKEFKKVEREVGKGVQQGINAGSALANDIASTVVDGGRGLVGSSMRAAIDLEADIKNAGISATLDSVRQAEGSFEIAKQELEQAQKEYYAVQREASGYANAAAAAAKGYTTDALIETYSGLAQGAGFANLVAADASSQAMGFKSYMDRMAKDSAAITNAQLRVLKKDMARTYSKARDLGERAYSDVMPYLTLVADSLSELPIYMANRCKAAFANNVGKIAPFDNKIKGLGANEKAALYRITNSLMRNSNPDAQTISDIKLVGTALGLITANGLALAGNAYKSNFTLSVGLGIESAAGVNISAGYAMDTFPPHNMAFTLNAGPQVSLGTADLVPGAEIQIDFTWSPGSSWDAQGITQGLSGTLGPVNVGTSWALSEDFLMDFGRNWKEMFSGNPSAIINHLKNQIDAICQIPSLSVGVGVPIIPGSTANATLKPGWTQVMWRGSVTGASQPAPPLVAPNARLDVLDTDYYIKKYSTPYLPRLTREEAKEHWLTRGIAAGNQSSEKFSVRAYLNRYPDLKAKFGNDYAAAVDHWNSIGYKEKLNPAP